MAFSHTVLVAGLGSRIEEFLGSVLTDHGYTIRTAIGPEAVFASLNEWFDLVLVDLPSEDELGYLRPLRNRCACAMIVIGPPRNGKLLVASLEQGADDYVQRPYRIDELMARMRAQMRRTPHTRPPSNER
ncbi:MAG: hypothetical protein WCF99_06420 [Chloroflexales bacterium]